MPQVSSNGIELTYEAFGDRADPALVLVIGLGCQMVHWDDQWCAQLAAAGFWVVRFDNRDVGCSTKLSHLGVPNVVRISAKKLLRLPVRSPYSLEDMADDTVGLLDALGLEQAHVVGASLGGMVAQLVAIRHPTRVRSLTSWMSTPGESRFRPTHRATLALIKRAPDDLDARVEHAVRVMRVIGSPSPIFDEVGIRRRAKAALARNTERAGFARQLAAVVAAAPRTNALRAMRGVPTLVLHGDVDPLIPVTAAYATAAAVRGARLVTFPNVGHDLPPSIYERAITAIADNAMRKL